ncbi:serine-threonine/tyrosine-protein kinase catalytic domain-containing protein [Tanacetum coccineum]
MNNNGRRSEEEESEYPFFEGDGSSSDEWRDYGMASDDYEGAPIFDDDYEEAPVFDDDQFEEESMPVYDTDIEDVIEEEEGFVGKGGFGEEEENMEDFVVVANDLCSSMIQTTLSVDFSKTIDSNPHELIWSQKGNLVEVSILIGKKYQEGYLKAKPMDDKFGFKLIKPKFLIKMPPRRTRNINDVYERIMARMDERLDQFVDQFSNRMNDMMNLRRCGDRNGRRSEDEELGNPFFEGGMTIFSKKVFLIVSPSNAENLVQDTRLNTMELYLDSIQGENQTFRRFDFDTINIATENFSEANKFVHRGYGSVYKGRLQNGQDIAVTLPFSIVYKRYKMHETSILVKLEHENLVKMLGYCIEGTKVFFIREFAPHLSLDHLIFDPMCNLLDWNKRYKIILANARVLLYLHKHAPVTAINKADCIPVNAVRGAISCVRGYTAPERLMKFNLSTKADVFNFGVVVRRNWLEGTSSNIIDHRIDVDSSSMTKYLEIGLLCVQDDPVDRPTMEEIVGMLLGKSVPTLPVTKMLEKMIGEHSTCITEMQVDDFDTSAVEEFVSDLCPR